MRYGRALVALAVLATVIACTGGGDDGDDGGGAADGLDPGAAPNSGDVELAPLFQPDPFMIEIRSGGDIDVDTLGLGADCDGFAISQPDFSLELTGASDGIRVFFVADSLGEDATLIINDAGGDWVCNDDYTGLDPLVQIIPADGGRYDIWVGSYSADDFVDGTLYITELELDPSDM